ncbi:hypothetical protein [Streptomyces sp. CAU 1734]
MAQAPTAVSPLVPQEQFHGQAGTTVPAAVHAPLLHNQLALKTDGE